MSISNVLNKPNNSTNGYRKAFQFSKAKPIEKRSQIERFNFHNKSFSNSKQNTIHKSSPFRYNLNNNANINTNSNNNSKDLSYSPSIQKDSNSLQLPLVTSNQNYFSSSIKKRRGRIIQQAQPLQQSQHQLSFVEANKISEPMHNDTSNSLMKIRNIINNINNKNTSLKSNTILKRTQAQKKSNRNGFNTNHNTINQLKDDEKKSVLIPRLFIVDEGKKSNRNQMNYRPEKRLSDDSQVLKKTLPAVKEKYLQMFFAKSQTGKSDKSELKINQDSFLLKTKVNGVKDFNLFGVLDGHGQYGHCASKYVTNYLENFFENEINISKLNTAYDIYRKLKEKNYAIIKGLFTSVANDIKKQPFDISFSGTTCVLLIQLGNKIISANVGDSRAIMVTKSMTSGYQPKQLSIDQKPEMKAEKNRIVKAGGRVDQYSEDGVKVGPFRVWLKNQQYPGLAMSRSIGDTVASNVGVISEPEIIEFELSTHTKECIIIASDGLWEFINNKRAMELSIPFIEKDDLDNLCKCLIDEAVSQWEKEDVVIDDITVVSAIFNHSVA